jgi:hypothetical protein
MPMSATITQPAVLRAGLLALALILPGGPAAAAPQPVALRFTTAISALAPRESMVIRLREDAPVGSTVEVGFIDADGHTVRRQTETLGPRDPATASLAYEDLDTDELFPGVYAVVLVTPNRPEQLADTRISLHVEFVHTEKLTIRDGGTCAASQPPSHGGGGRDYTCTGGINVSTVFANAGP